MALKRFPLMGLLLFLSIVGSPTMADDPVCPATTSKSLSRAMFPKGFLFGTATASYQVEGAVYETGRGRSLWDSYCKKNPERCNNENGDVAVDFFHRYKEDIQLMKNLNTDAFRLSIAWPRIFPYGKRENGVSQAGVKFYHDVLDELKRNGITPVVTIFHWDIPQDLEDEYGGFLDKRIVRDFRNYAEFLFQEYGGKVKHWVTINQPWVYAHAGYDTGKKAPGRCTTSEHSWRRECLGGESGKEAYIVSHNLLLAHAEAVEAFRSCQKWHQCEGGKIGIAHSPTWFEPYDTEGDTESVPDALDFMLGWHLGPTTTGDYPARMKEKVGDRLPLFTEEEKAKLKDSTDFVGINYYTSKFIKHIGEPNEEQRRLLQDSGSEWRGVDSRGYRIGSRPDKGEIDVYSRGLRNLLKHVKDNYSNPEIWILENGYGDVPEENAKDVSIEDGTADNDRKIYIFRHLLSLYKSICLDKVNVKGYFVWSLLDNFEWQDGYKVRYGLYYVDFKNNLERHEKASAKYYREFLSQGVRPSQI